MKCNQLMHSNELLPPSTQDIKLLSSAFFICKSFTKHKSFAHNRKFNDLVIFKKHLNLETQLEAKQQGQKKKKTLMIKTVSETTQVPLIM